MKLDEFAFVNQQLASMLRSGIPLEGALKQLCTSMQRGMWRSELQALEADLVTGTPLRDAIKARKLPAFYVQMLQVGVQSNDLPAMLSLLADYYHRTNAVMTRLKGLMLYPLCVLLGSLALSIFLTIAISSMLNGVLKDMMAEQLPAGALLMLWLPLMTIALLTAITLIGVAIPRLNRSLRWRLPGFKETNLTQFASAMHLLLKGGCPLHDAVDLMAQLERGSPAGEELVQWQKRLASGEAKFSAIASEGRMFPPLFRWLVAHGGENLAAGFERAAVVYQGRANFRVEMLL